MPATPLATRAFANSARPKLDFFRLQGDLTFSTLGLGTYLGSPDDATDANLVQAVSLAATLGYQRL